MSVGGIGGGGRSRGPGVPKAPAAPDSVGKTSGSDFDGRVDKTDSFEPTSKTVASKGPGTVDPVTAYAKEIARKLRSGEISSKDEATKQLIADILREKLRMQSTELTSRIANALTDDPRLNEALGRLWSKEG